MNLFFGRLIFRPSFLRATRGERKIKIMEIFVSCARILSCLKRKIRDCSQSTIQSCICTLESGKLLFKLRAKKGFISDRPLSINAEKNNRKKYVFDDDEKAVRFSSVFQSERSLFLSTRMTYQRHLYGVDLGLVCSLI